VKTHFPVALVSLTRHRWHSNAFPIEAPLVPFKVNVSVTCLMAIWGATCRCFLENISEIHATKSVIFKIIRARKTGWRESVCHVLLINFWTVVKSWKFEWSRGGSKPNISICHFPEIHKIRSPPPGPLDLRLGSDQPKSPCKHQGY
jgi:hypothetical protein